MLGLCFHSGRFDFGAYQALNERVTWQEADRIRTAVTVLADNAEDYGEWRRKWETDKATRGVAGTHTSPTAITGLRGRVSPESLRAEIDTIAAQLDKIKSKRADHRTWVVTKGERGARLDQDQIDAAEAMEATQVNTLAGLRQRLAAMEAGS